MEHYQLLNITHAALAILLTLGLIAHIVILWKAWRRADAAVLQQKLRRTRLISLPLLAVLALLLPLSGWWLAGGCVPGRGWARRLQRPGCRASRWPMPG
ncbi:DUF2269 family protein [Stutzerimonas nitrititolerans]|uniref:DUF2269 family protein n=1 Tax=Stutzerimonas nitrititolerans TaxID=2482751 RepID=UPI0035E3D0E9